MGMGNNELDGLVWRWSPSPACVCEARLLVCPRGGGLLARPCRLRLVIERGITLQVYQSS